MDPAIKRGFLIGFVVIATVCGVFAWRDGWFAPAVTKTAVAPPAVVGLVPRLPGKPPPPAAEPPAAQNPAAQVPAVRGGEANETGAPPARADRAPDGPRSGSGGSASKPSPTPSVAAGAGPPSSEPPEKGAFDVVRVEPSGDLVVAGRCPANCTVELTANGKVQDRARADAGGAFAMTPSALAPGDHQLGLRVTTPDGRSTTSEQSVTVSVPQPPSKEVVVVLNDPDAPSRILQRPGQAPAAPSTVVRAPVAGGGPVAPDVAPRSSSQTVAALSLGAVDAENGRFFVQGAAPSGARLRVYLNNALVAEPVAGADGRWSLRVERGLSPGAYVARVDQVDASGKVVSRAEARFGYEPEVATAEPTRSANERAAAKTPAPKASGLQGPQTSSAAAAISGARVPGVHAPAGTGDGAAARGPAPGAAPASVGSTAGRSGVDPSSRGSAAAPGASPPARVAARGEADRGPSRSPEGPAGAPLDLGRSPAAGDGPAAAAGTGPSEDRESTTMAAPDPANPVIASLDTAMVKHGDSLWRISRATYGHGRRYTVIFTANDEQIRDPALIYPGQVLVLPSQRSDASGASSLSDR